MHAVSQLCNPRRNLARFAGFSRPSHAKCRTSLQGHVLYVSQWHGGVQMAGYFRAVRPEDMAVVYFVFCCVRVGQ